MTNLLVFAEELLALKRSHTISAEHHSGLSNNSGDYILYYLFLLSLHIIPFHLFLKTDPYIEVFVLKSRLKTCIEVKVKKQTKQNDVEKCTC